MNASKEQAHEASDRLWDIFRFLERIDATEQEKDFIRGKLRDIGEFVSACKNKLPCEKSYEKQKSRK